MRISELGRDFKLDKKSSRLIFILQAVLLVLALALRLAALDADIPLEQNADDLGDEGYWFAPAHDLLRLGSLNPVSNFFQAPAGAPLSLLAISAIGKVNGELTLYAARLFPAVSSWLLLVAGTVYFAVRLRSQFGAVLFIALYGFFPLFVLYSRICHLEQPVLLFLFLAFALLEAGSGRSVALCAGFCSGIALLLKSVAIFVFPALLLYLLIERREKTISFLMGLTPCALILGAWTGFNYGSFSATFQTLASYHQRSGFFIDRFSFDYFWLRPVALPYLPWITVGILLTLLPGTSLLFRSWSFIWFASTLFLLSIFRYQSVARHELIFFPLMLFTLLSFIHAGRLVKARSVRWYWAAVLAPAVLLPCFTTFFWLSPALFNPKFSYRDASTELARLTSETDLVAGAHAHALSLQGNYLPLMQLSVARWNAIDNMDRVSPTVVLIPRMYNGVKAQFHFFPQAERYPFRAKIGTLNYLERFESDVFRVFPDQDSLNHFVATGQ